MRDLQARRRRYFQNFSFQDSKPLCSRTFLTALKKKLQSQADSKKWFSILYHVPNHRNQLISVKVFHCLPKASHSRKNYFVHTFQYVRIPGNNCFLAQIGERFFYTSHISCIIIYNTDHISFLFVKNLQKLTFYTFMFFYLPIRKTDLLQCPALFYSFPDFVSVFQSRNASAAHRLSCNPYPLLFLFSGSGNLFFPMNLIFFMCFRF